MTALRRRETVVADRSSSGERLDIFLARALGASRKAVKRALDGGQVFVDGRTVRRAGHLLAGGETVAATLDEAPSQMQTVAPSVLFRDDHLLALAKPPGLPSHPTVAGGPNALDWATDLLRGEGRQTPPILLHRLDADTSGLLLFALTAESNRTLSRAFADREVEKIYLALVAGSPPDQFAVANFLRPGRRGRVEAVRSGGQPAETFFRTLSRGPGFSLVEARPKTGRTHQIRVHLAGEGYPLLGDVLYGGPTAISVEGRTLTASRHLLHAFRLAFRHPATGETLTLEAPVPEDFAIFLEFQESVKTRIFSYLQS